LILIGRLEARHVVLFLEPFDDHIAHRIGEFREQYKRLTASVVPLRGAKNWWRSGAPWALWRNGICLAVTFQKGTCNACSWIAIKSPAAVSSSKQISISGCPRQHSGRRSKIALVDVVLTFARLYRTVRLDQAVRVP
jgi:hypothetical protein